MYLFQQNVMRMPLNDNVHICFLKWQLFSIHDRTRYLELEINSWNNRFMKKGGMSQMKNVSFEPYIHYWGKQIIFVLWCSSDSRIFSWYSKRRKKKTICVHGVMFFATSTVQTPLNRKTATESPCQLLTLKHLLNKKLYHVVLHCG